MQLLAVMAAATEMEFCDFALGWLFIGCTQKVSNVDTCPGVDEYVGIVRSSGSHQEDAKQLMSAGGGRPRKAGANQNSHTNG